MGKAESKRVAGPIGLDKNTNSEADFSDAMDAVESQFGRHSFITWVLLPAFVLSQAFIPCLQPTCEHGFNNVTLVVVLLVEFHQICAEARAWHALKKLIASPELSVLSHLGVLRKRKGLVLMGIIQSVVLYTDLTFPLMARDCVGVLSDKWQTSWMKVPFVGPVMRLAVEQFRFWGFAAICVGLNVLVTGILGMISMRSFASGRKQNDENMSSMPLSVSENCPRISGDVFFAWAGAAEVAMMPSVTRLCEEMADQRQWVYDPKDARDAMQARRDTLFGKIGLDVAVAKELANKEHYDHVMNLRRRHYVGVLFARVFLGNVLSLWLQASFLALTFDNEAWEGKVKLVCSMVVSALQALMRCQSAVARAEGPASLVTSLIFVFIVWTAVKVYMAFSCHDHLWNLTTGCVNLSQ